MKRGITIAEPESMPDNCFHYFCLTYKGATFTREAQRLLAVPFEAGWRAAQEDSIRRNLEEKLP